MNLNEKIEKLLPKLTCRYTLNAYCQIDILVCEIQKEVKRAIINNKSDVLNSVHLRELTMQIAKIHKELNKKIDFMEINKQFQKHDLIDDDIYLKVAGNVIEYMTCINIIQHCLNRLNLFVVTLDLIEKGNQNDENTFNYLIAKAVKDCIN